jgi:hypothetical protein
MDKVVSTNRGTISIASEEDVIELRPAHFQARGHREDPSVMGIDAIPFPKGIREPAAAAHALDPNRIHRRQPQFGHGIQGTMNHLSDPASRAGQVGHTFGSQIFVH